MARIAVGGLHHETNSFAPVPADWEAFDRADGWPARQRGPSLFDGVAGINLPISGFIDAARAAGHELVPLVWANACPSGPVTDDAFERLCGQMLEDLAAAGPLDGIFLDLHGAMITASLDDGEGELLARIRRARPSLPLVAALDLHANVSAAMVEHADVLLAYRTYPHVDLAATGARCLEPLQRLIRGERLAKAHRKLDFLIPLPWQATVIEPAAGLYALADALGTAIAGHVSIAMGFPAGDTRAAGPSILAYGADPAAVAGAVDRLADAFAQAEGAFAGTLWSPREAVAEAMRRRGRGPVILADTQDNPGGGGTGDTTGILAALLEAPGVSADLALLADPTAAAAAHAAGPGAVLHDLPLGGRHGPAGVVPIRRDWRVERLGSGRFTATGPMYRGNRMELGPMALLRADGTDVRVLVSTGRVQAADRAIFAHLGVDPARSAILVLKSSVHFRADFAPLAEAILVVEAPGQNVVDPATLPFRRLPEGLRRRPRAAAG
jgi:microcystin degradation protein MlrC